MELHEITNLNLTESNAFYYFEAGLSTVVSNIPTPNIHMSNKNLTNKNIF